MLTLDDTINDLERYLASIDTYITWAQLRYYQELSVNILYYRINELLLLTANTLKQSTHYSLELDYDEYISRLAYFSSKARNLYRQVRSRQTLAELGEEPLR